jgi:uncharacterized protein YbjT (DUF2867 family)
MVLITGANGHLGRRLIAALAGQTPVRAVVRSERAAAMIDVPGVEVRILDYLDRGAMTDAAAGCSHLVHLVGIIRESAANPFADAHEGTSAVVAEAAAAAGLSGVIYLSILGAAEDSHNACLASKARAERLLAAGSVPALILRIPMVLGEGDYASRALYRRARSRISVQLRAASLEQPIYAGDVVAAILAGLERVGGGAGRVQGVLELAGPESLSRGALTRRAAGLLGGHTSVVSLPFWLGDLAAALLERLSANAPVSRSMLGVLDHDDRIDPGPALQFLGIDLTPLDVALKRCLVESP